MNGMCEDRNLLYVREREILGCNIVRKEMVFIYVVQYA